MTESVFYDDRSGRLEKLRAIDVAVIDCAQGRGRPRVKVRSPRSKSPFRCSATKNHVSIDRAYGFVRRFAVSNAAAHNGARLPDVLDKTNTASQVWAKRAKGSVKRSLMDGAPASL